MLIAHSFVADYWSEYWTFRATTPSWLSIVLHWPQSWVGLSSTHHLLFSILKVISSVIIVAAFYLHIKVSGLPVWMLLPFFFFFSLVEAFDQHPTERCFYLLSSVHVYIPVEWSCFTQKMAKYEDDLGRAPRGWITENKFMFHALGWMLSLSTALILWITFIYSKCCPLSVSM